MPAGIRQQGAVGALEGSCPDPFCFGSYLMSVCAGLVSAHHCQGGVWELFGADEACRCLMDGGPRRSKEHPTVSQLQPLLDLRM